MSDKNLEKEVKDFTPEDDLDLFFNGFIKKGHVEEEREVVPGLKLKLKALSTAELLSAESIMFMDRNVPNDIVVKVRSASILSQAIISINGMIVEKDGQTKEQISARRGRLYKQLLDMSAYVIQKAYDLYIEIVEKQRSFYENPEKTLEKIENF